MKWFKNNRNLPKKRKIQVKTKTKITNMKMQFQTLNHKTKV